MSAGKASCEYVEEVSSSQDYKFDNIIKPKGVGVSTSQRVLNIEVLNIVYLLPRNITYILTL